LVTLLAVGCAGLRSNSTPSKVRVLNPAQAVLNLYSPVALMNTKPCHLRVISGM